MLCRNPSDVDDLLQAAAMKALAAHQQFTLGSNMSAWLYRIMRNEYLDIVRRKGRNHPHLDDVPETFLASAGSQDDRHVLRDVMRGIRRLTEKQRETLYLCCVERLSYDEVAVIQGCAIGTIKSRLFRAREEVKRFLNSGDNKPEDSAQGE